MRKLLQTIASRATQDGDGVKIQRLAGNNVHTLFNPFLMIDEINSDDAADYIGGFPTHGHRGFETITYMKAGRMRHRDHMGNEGVIAAGDIQWMTAGAGVLHSEMPEQEQGLLHGFQIWLNLPSVDKMQPARYQEISKDKVIHHTLASGGQISIVAGRVSVEGLELQGPIRQAATKPVFVDAHLRAGQSLTLEFNKDFPALVYVYDGQTESINTKTLGVYDVGQTLQLNAGSTGARLLILSGKPIDEPIVQYGPFVMNTRQEIDQALHDFNDPNYLEQLG